MEALMKNIKQDIKNGKMKKVYLVYGEEEYLKKNIKKSIITGLTGDADSMNCSIYEGKNIDLKEIMNMCDTLPFLGDKRLVIMENTGILKKTDEKFMEYVKTGIPDTSCLVIMEQEADKRGKMYKLIKSEGYVCECSHPKESDLSKWVLGMLGREGKKITKPVMDYFLASAGNDMEKISSELEKLFCYTMGREVIEIEDIDNICSPEINGKIFAMIDAMGARKQKEALDLYYDLINTREAPMKILYMISRQFNIMLQVKELVSQGYSSKDIASKMGMSPFVIGGAVRQCGNFSNRMIRTAINESLAVEEDIKSGRMEEKTGVEMLLIRFSARKVK